MGYLLGIDIGTSSVKSMLLRADDGVVLANAEHEYPLLKPRPEYAEQIPEDWWLSTIHSVRQVLSTSAIDTRDIRALGLSGQMHGTVCLDAANKPIRPAIIWADNRSRSQCATLEAEIGLSDLPKFAPGLPVSGFMGPTLMWLHEHEPDTIEQTNLVLLPKDYVRYRLTGHLGTDVSDAWAAWLFDIESSQWSQDLIKFCGVDDRYLPSVSNAFAIVGALTPKAAAELGLPSDIPVVAGCADQPAQAIGNGLLGSDKLLLTIGTGGQIFYPQTSPIRDSQSRYYVFNHVVPKHWYALATILAGGLALRWIRNLLGLQNNPDAYEMMSIMAKDVQAAAEGLFFIPHLAGQRLPQTSTPSAGAFLGLKLHHDSAHLIRAVMEGVTFAMKEQLSLLDVENAQVIISGGAARSPLWRQIQANIYGKSLFVNHNEANHASIGAALIAGIGCGYYDTFEDACTLVTKPTQVVEPDASQTSDYHEIFAHYQALYAGISVLKSSIE